MAWHEDKYIRQFLDAREKWGTFLSLAAVAGLLLFLADHPHRPWVNLGPLVIGAFGSLFVLVVNCYNEQAEAIAQAQSKDDKDAVKQSKAAKWHKYAGDIGFLGWLHILAGIALGTLATLALFFGMVSVAAD